MLSGRVGNQYYFLVIRFTQVINFFWIPGRGRFAPLPGMTDLRISGSFVLFST